MMVPRLLLLLVVTALLLVCGRADDEVPEASDVLSLDGSSFANAIAENELIAVEFFSPWCGHCKSLAPEWEKAATAMKGKVPVAKVDCTANQELCGEQGIQGYPTLKLFRGGEASPMEVARKSEAIATFLTKELAPAVTLLTDGGAAVDAFVAAHPVAAIAFLDNDHDDRWAQFKAAALKKRHVLDFAAVLKADDAKLPAPALVLYRDSEESKLVYTGEFATAPMALWISRSLLPTLGEISAETFPAYMAAELKMLGYLFVDPNDASTATLLKELEPKLTAYRDDFAVAWINNNRYAQQATRLGLSSKVPSLALDNHNDGIRFVFPDEKTMSAESLAEWFADFKAGKLTPFVKSEPIPESNDTPVKVIVAHTFKDIVHDESKDVLVEFYAPWCGHCKKLTPEYAKAASTLSSNDPVVKLGKVDATIESDLGSRFGVSGYPTLKVFRGGSASEYKGPRDAAGIVSYMKKQAAPSITDIKTLADLEKFIAEEAGVVYFGEAGSKLAKAFDQSAGKLRESFRFARASADDILEKFGHKNEVVLLQAKRYAQSPLESIKAVYKEGEGELAKFIHDNILPLVGEVHEDNLNVYSGRNKPLMKVYSDVDWKLNAKGANYVLNRIRKIAKEYKDKISFALASKTKHQREIEDSGLSGDLPFAIHDLGKQHKFPGSGGFSPEAFKKHIDDYLAGKLEPYIKSEPVPEHVPGEPTVVVGKNFNDIVMDPTKDVLIEAYAPWCGHCKQLEPKYKELAAKMAPYSDSVVIAKIDATANDMPSAYQARGYPTIFFAPANNKDKPLTFDGAREVKDFVSYIKKNAHLPLKKKDGATTKGSVGGKDEL